MRRRATALLAAALLGCCLPPAAGAAPPAAAVTAGPAAVVPFDAAPAQASLRRLLPGRADRFRLVPVARGTAGDSFAVSGGGPEPVEVRGTSGATLLSGVGWYLEQVAKVDLGWPGDSLGRLPATLPAVGGTVSRAATVPHRYALNDTDAGYSGPYRDFAAYQHEIDLLALHGVNEVFVQTGAEWAYHRALQQFGYGEEELRAWIPAPAHQSWWLLQNMAAFGGPESARLLDARAALGREIADQLRALGMTPVLPGFFGTVPPGFAERNPGARVVPQGSWVGFARADWLDPTGPVFDRLAAAYYRAQRERFGDSTMYKMDLLHEGGVLGPVDASRAAGAVQDALRAAHPGATWVILGWQDNPSAALLDGVDRSGLLILDGLADRYPQGQLDRDRQWRGTPYAFGTIDNFGGHTSIGANTAAWVSRFQQQLTAAGSALRGIAYLPEATGGDPAAFELFTELAWQQGPIDQRAWFADYAARRYGGPDPHAAAAWELLRQGPYSMPADGWSEPQDGLFAARPSLTAATAATWSPTAMRYPADSVRAALDQLLQVAPAQQGCDAYRFDLVNVARQALGNQARELLPRIAAAYATGDRAAFGALTGRWHDDELLLDRLLASDARFLLGRWLAEARSWGADASERGQLEYDARSILTTWGDHGPSEDGQLHDYANREWSGLLTGLYAQRWSAYFASLDAALANGGEPAALDWYALDDAWAHRSTDDATATATIGTGTGTGTTEPTEPTATEPTGDPVALARTVAATLADSAAAERISRPGATPAPGAVPRPGAAGRGPSAR
ncbi:alpha-N-acetylglucosaminidase [Kitasatospora sp. NBC_01302]|uniref:alpha-N-acetylglucosaminidase n=1 Tax=Kitasatospora sp. NBC_01302 TaxID=2903575 RepID=UPI002E14A990|nr:alpha-N-acetylglucosaminidase [Kitasatospora sp. NBC_01302]